MSGEPQEGQKRRLAAILFADVVSYSRLVGLDEERTVAAVHRLVERARVRVESHAGRIVKTIGDAIMVEFESPVNALKCTVELQADLAATPEMGPDGKPLRLRAGLHAGDVIHRGDDLFGDAVNIAARLEGKAAAGGVAISSQVRQLCGNKVEVEYQSLGRLPLKNIAADIEVFQVLAPGVAHVTAAERRAAAWRSRRPMLGAGVAVLCALIAVGIVVRTTWYPRYVARTLPDGPVAVVPFEQLGEDKEPVGRILADVVGARVATWPGVEVLSPLVLGARLQKLGAGATVEDYRAASESAGAALMVTGTVTRIGPNVRAQALLHRLDSGQLVTSAEVTAPAGPDLLDHLGIALARPLRSYVVRRWDENDLPLDAPTRSVPAYAEFLEARELMWGMGRGRDAMAHFERAVTLDPDFGLAWSNYACSAAILGEAETATRAARRSTELVDTLPPMMRHIVRGNAASTRGDVDEAERAYAVAAEVAPHSTEPLIHRAAVRYYLRKDPAGAIPIWQRIIDMNPRYFPVYAEMAGALRETGDGDGAVETARRYANQVPTDARGQVLLGFQLLASRQLAESRRAFEKALELEAGNERALRGLKRLAELDEEAAEAAPAR